MCRRGVFVNAESQLVAAVRNARLDDFVHVQAGIRKDAIHSPLLTYTDGARAIRLKAECLQPLGSFKIRAAASVLNAFSPALLEQGVATASAGNFAQGLALAARRRGVALTVHAPDNAASVKLASIRELGARVVVHSFVDWWTIMSTRETGTQDGVFIHPVCEPGVILGNGSIGLELAQDWPELDTAVIPFGGGGLASGIALALRAKSMKVRIVACEIETAAPLAASLAAKTPVRVERRPSFIDGIGSNSVLTEMWPLVRELIDDVIVVTVDEAQDAVRELAFRQHLIAEGAGAVAFAAARSPRCGGKRVAAVISGGNIDPKILARILTTV